MSSLEKLTIQTSPGQDSLAALKQRRINFLKAFYSSGYIPKYTYKVNFMVQYPILKLQYSV